VSEAPAALFDVGRLRALEAPTIGVLRVDEPLVVLGSTQHVEDLDHRRLEDDGIAVRRRRGGGGAVLLRPEDCWIELWLPASTDGERHDVRATAYRVGEWWGVALGGLGLDGSVHRGAVLRAAQGAVACFAGLGPGELTVGGRKLVGLSQWRSREGALVSSVLAARPPADLARYLAGTAATAPELRLATSLEETLRGVTVDAVAEAFVTVVRGRLGSLAVSSSTFA